MSISIDLRVLAKKLEKNSDSLLAKAQEKGDDVFNKITTAVAAASTLLEEVADDIDNNSNFNITEKQLDDMAALATALDNTKNPALQKQASVLDEILLSIAAPKNAIAKAKQANEDEINRLRAELSKKRQEEAYEKPREVQSENNLKKEQAKAVDQQVKKYMPLEAPLQTRYPPDRPGGQMTRITDGVYQDIVTGIIYDFKNGYTTQKGNVIPGTSVENQTKMLHDNVNKGTSVFETRESISSRYASDSPSITKIASLIGSISKNNPELLNDAIDYAYDNGMSTRYVAEIIAQAADIETENFDEKPLSGTINNEQDSEKVMSNIIPLLNDLRDAGWVTAIRKELEYLRNIGMFPKHLMKLEQEYYGDLEDSVYSERIRKHHLPAELENIDDGSDNDEDYYGDDDEDYNVLDQKELLGKAPTMYQVDTNAPTVHAQASKKKLTLKDVFAGTVFDELFGLETKKEEEPKKEEPKKEVKTEEVIKPKSNIFDELFGLTPEKPVEKKVDTRLNPENDRDKWLEKLEAVKQEFEGSPESLWIQGEYILKGKEDQARKLMQEALNRMMNERNAVGPYEVNDKGISWYTLAGLKLPELPENKLKNVGEYWNVYKSKYNSPITEEQIQKIENSVQVGMDGINSLLNSYKLKSNKKAEIEDYIKQYRYNLRKYIIDNQLEMLGQPKMFGGIKSPDALALANMLEQNSVDVKGSSSSKQVKVTDYPGLVYLWDDPEGYNEALKQSISEVKAELSSIEVTETNKEEVAKKEKDLLNQKMSEKGFVPPYGKIFNTQSIMSLKRGAGTDLELADFGNLKTLFSNTAEYVKNYNMFYKQLEEKILSILKDKGEPKPERNQLVEMIELYLPKYMEEAGFYPPNKPALGSKTFGDMIKADKKAQAMRMSFFQKGKGEDEESGGKAMPLGKDRLESLKQMESKDLITPDDDFQGWMSVFTKAKQLGMASKPESKKDFFDFVNIYMEKAGYAPAYSSKGNPERRPWYQEVQRISPK